MKLDHGLATAIMGVAIAFIQPQIAMPLTAQDVSNIAKDITVVINGASDTKLGSGVIIYRQGKSYSVLTNWHVVGESGNYIIQTRDKSQHQAVPNSITRVPEADLALIQFTSDKVYSTATFGNSDTAKEGTTIFVSGAPEPVQGIKNRTVLVLMGQIVGTNTQPEEGYTLIYNNNTHRGMSGGPVLDENGRLIGIHGRGARDGDGQKVGFNLGIPINLFVASKTASKLKVQISIPQTNLTDTSTNSRPIGRPTVINGSEGVTGSGVVCAGHRCE
ncbi:MAG: serine protease [Desmonostoc vinosum HA7617-LM4]|jgi:S1-C subfamily serine protease|nr:serine protease [Desmonostoc vinosum HA7617-LM4]